MTLRNKNLVNGMVIGIADTTIYTAPTSLLRTIITQGRVVNSSAATADLTIWVLQPGDIAANNTKAIIEKTIPVNGSIILSDLLNEVITVGGSIHALSSTANSLSISFSGLEVTA